MEPRHVDRLAALATEVNFERDQIIFREGDTHNQFYIIVTGKVSLEITMPGRVFRILVVEDGGELGWSFMLTKGGKHFQARALQRVHALAFDGDQLQKACGADAALGYRLMSRVLRVVSSRLQATRLHFLDFHFPETTLPRS
jgi:CRP-like cAMP-binding protein